MVDKVKIDFTSLLSYFDVISENSIELCKEYSDNPELLDTFLHNNKFSVNVRVKGVEKAFNNSSPTYVLDVLIKNEKKEISFNFHISIRETAIIILLNSNIWKCNEETKKLFKIINYMSSNKDFFDIVENSQKKNNFRKKLIQLKKEFEKNLLYSILCSCNSEFYCPDSFEEFCMEFGYDEDSRKAYKTFKECSIFSEKLQYIFSENIIETFPS
jgi:hypothetical protein